MHTTDMFEPKRLLAADPDIAARLTARQAEINAGASVSARTRAGLMMGGAVLATAALASDAFAQGLPSMVVDILNFALTLEYLETDFYKVKGKTVGLSGQAKAYATQFGAEEAEHVTALAAAIKQLGGTPVKKPTFVFPVTSESSFLKLASVLENTGVGAYNGAAPSLASKDVLASAGAIVQVEARHAAAIDLLIGTSPTPDQGFDRPLSKTEVLAKAGPLIKA